MPAAAGDTRSRDRPAGGARPAILTATEDLLRERPLHEVSVADIIDAAGVSRTSFYAHFASKTAVIAECLRGLMDQVTVATAPLRTRDLGDPETAIRLSLMQWVEVCRRHGPLLRTASERWPYDAELRELWLTVLRTRTDETARLIRAARRHPPASAAGADPTALAACLMWGFERVLHLSLVGHCAELPEPGAIVEPLVQMMLGSVYGRPPA